MLLAIRNLAYFRPCFIGVNHANGTPDFLATAIEQNKSGRKAKAQLG